MVLAEMTLSCAGLYIVMLAEFTGLVDDEAFEHDEGTAFGVEKIILRIMPSPALMAAWRRPPI